MRSLRRRRRSDDLNSTIWPQQRRERETERKKKKEYEREREREREIKEERVVRNETET